MKIEQRMDRLRRFVAERESLSDRGASWAELLSEAT